MMYNKFYEFWSQWTQMWYSETIIVTDGEKVNVSDICAIKSNYAVTVYKKYEAIKNIVKQSYFKNIQPDNEKSCHLSRYKRAAVLTYAIIQSDPIVFFKKTSDIWLDPYFLKQRLAFYMAIGSIIQDVPSEYIEQCKLDEKKLYSFELLGNSNCSSGSDDDFLMSVYKDLLYSEVYDNFNVLTMANVYGLLTEKCSVLVFNDT